MTLENFRNSFFETDGHNGKEQKSSWNRIQETAALISEGDIQKRNAADNTDTDRTDTDRQYNTYAVSDNRNNMEVLRTRINRRSVFAGYGQALMAEIW